MSKNQIETKLQAADKGQGMTLDELSKFVETARMMGAQGNDPVRVGVGFAGQVKDITTKPAKG